MFTPLKRWWRNFMGPRHEGATVQYGKELRALRTIPTDPRLVSDTEWDLDWAQAWHEWEREMLDYVGERFTPLLNAADEIQTFEELREHTCPRELVAA